MRKIVIMSITILLVLIFIVGCSVNSTQQSDQQLYDEHMVAVTVKKGLEASFNYDYRTTTGLEGSEYYTDRYLNEVQAIKENQQRIINQRKEKKLIAKIIIDDGIYDILINGNQASATANYQRDFLSTDTTYDGTGNGKIEVQLVKENGKWLMDNIQFYEYQD